MALLPRSRVVDAAWWRFFTSIFCLLHAAASSYFFCLSIYANIMSPTTNSEWLHSDVKTILQEAADGWTELKGTERKVRLDSVVAEVETKLEELEIEEPAKLYKVRCII